MKSIQGKNFIGNLLSAQGNQASSANNPATGEVLNGSFISPTPEEVDLAVEKAQTAYQAYGKLSQMRRAEFLEQIGREILALGDDLVQRANAETALPEARIIGERSRTVNQLLAFADLLREGSWVEAIIDTTDPSRQPIPKVDIRRMLIPIGPVVVFAASNFPLAFSTAGGDTASALAGGNPVIVKAHSGHPGTSELIAHAIIAAAIATKMPDGVFSMLHGSGRVVGQALVKHPFVKAVGFTGSTFAGRTLLDIANNRPEPIPVFAEMGSVNPVFIAPAALEKRGKTIAEDYAGSITLGTGQFCTNPGIIFGLKSEKFEQFIANLSAEIEKIKPSTMLNKTLFQGFNSSYNNVLSQNGITINGKSAEAPDSNKLEVQPTIATVDGKVFLANPELRHEVFGPFSLVIICEDNEELHNVAAIFSGQLTATVMAEESELDAFSEIIRILQNCSGRLIFNGVPTGVEVCAAMQHGGPYPAATDSRFTSVGTCAIKRFVRPVAYQNWPQSALPDELKDENPLSIWRLHDKNWQK